MAIRIAFVGEPWDVIVHLHLERCGDHPARALASELVERRPRPFLPGVTLHYVRHRRTFPGLPGPEFVFQSRGRSSSKRHGFDPEKHGEREVKTLGWQTRKHCMNLARAFFNWSLDEETFGLTANPFLGLSLAREDGDEDAQEGWYLDPKESSKFLGAWSRTDIGLDEGDRMEKWIVEFAMGSGLRQGEQWCLHLDDVHVDASERRPRVEVKYGSWDGERRRYRAPKGRKGEKKNRTVYLFGAALEAARAWKALLPVYAPKNPLGLMFPTERGARRAGNPRSWRKVVEAYGVLPRIGRKVWWHLLRHTCASSLVSGWWGLRWSLEDVSKVLGHTDVRTTQIYAHLAPSALQATATRAQAAYMGSFHGLSTPQRPAARSARNDGHARSDSNRRHSASKACQNADFIDEFAVRDGVVTAIRHVLELIAEGELGVSVEILGGLERALEDALERYAAAARIQSGRRQLKA